MGSVVGIDLGTTNTVTASVRAGRVHVLADEQGHRLLPSVVNFHPSGDVVVGRAAKDRRVVDARNTVGSIKRLIGRSWGTWELERAQARFPFLLREGPGQTPVVEARGQTYTLPEISAFVLKRAKQIAEAALGDTVEKAVITVPANFNELQRASTKVAGRIAGLDVLRILNEPTAAALAYGFGRGGHERIAVYDFGGGTFDCTLLEMNGNVFEVLATAGDSFLGGDDIDDAIADRIAEAFLVQHRVDVKHDKDQLERLRAAGEQLKIALSTGATAEAHLREMAFGDKGAHLDMRFGLTRTELDAMMQPLLERTLAVCQDALSVAALPVSAFDKVILVGGSTRIPLVRQTVERFFGTKPMDRLNPDEVVGIGAAIQAAALADIARRRSIPPPPPGRKTLPSLSGIEPALRPPRAPMASHPALDETQSAPRLPVASIPEVQLDIDPDKQVTREVQSPLTDVAKGYADAQPTRMVAPSANELLASTMDPQADSAATQPFKRTPMPPRRSEVPKDVSTMDALPASDDQTNPGAAVLPPPNFTSTQRMASASSARASGHPPAQPAPFGVFPKSAPIMAQSSPTTTQVMPAIRPLAVVPPNPPTVPPPGQLAAPVLVDVTPRALVVETVGGFCDAVVARNSKIPCSRARAFSPGRDHQSTVRIRVAQGESSLFAENTYLGELELSGLRAAPRGDVVIAVVFEIDSSGILRVRATDTATGREARATLQLIGMVTEESIARLAATTAKRNIIAEA